MTSFDFAARLDRARRVLAAGGIDVLLASVGADLPYLTGYRAMPLERLTMLVVPADAAATLVVPALEAPRVESHPEAFAIRPWQETEDPVAVVAALCGKARSVAVGDATWSVFTLALQQRMPKARFSPASPVTRTWRMRKDPAEAHLLRRAAGAADRVVARLADEAFSGRTERDLAAAVAGMTVEEGHEAATFAIVAAGPNGASPHHEPTDRMIREGDAVVVDLGGRLGGYCSDVTRMFFVGEPPSRFGEALAAVRAAQEAATAVVAPGVPAEEVDRAARRTLTGAGYGPFFIHRTGHGIGLEEHEHPYIVEGERAPLEPGMAFSIEPGVYLPGEFGVRLEDIVLVTDEGVEVLNAAPRHLVRVR